MDRDELDVRIRQRRGPETPYRRGGYADEWSGDAGGYAPFEPEPEDALAVREEAASGSAAPRVDHVDDAYVAPGPAPAWPAADEVAASPDEADAPVPAADPWRRGREVPDESAPSIVPPIPPAVPIDAAPPPDAFAAPEVDPWAAAAAPDAVPAPEAPASGYDERAYGDDADAYGAYAPGEEPWDAQAYEAYDEEPRRNGGLAIVAFLAIGALALIVGAFLSGIFTNSGVASTTPTATPTAAVTSTPEPTQAQTPSTSGGASGSANSSEGPPIVFPDGFVAQTQACATQPNGSGCNSDGSTNNGKMWVWIGFEKGSRNDVIGMTILDSAGNVSAQASIELSQLGCGATGACNGWILFPGFGTPYTGLNAGDYRIRINRNGLPAAEAPFTVQ
jgi:hypothetical protein